MDFNLIIRQTQLCVACPCCCRALCARYYRNTVVKLCFSMEKSKVKINLKSNVMSVQMTYYKAMIYKSKYPKIYFFSFFILHITWKWSVVKTSQALWYCCSRRTLVLLINTTLPTEDNVHRLYKIIKKSLKISKG